MDMREELKKLLLEKSFKLGDFTLSSGAKSDYYIDARIASLDPDGAFYIASLFLKRIVDIRADAVGGLTIGADPIVGAVVALSHSLSSPVHGFIVRKETKKHGTAKIVEGNLRSGDRVAIVEDVVTSGASAMKAVEAARSLGGEVIEILAVVDREEGGREFFEKNGLKLMSLFSVSELKEAASKVES